MADQLFLTNDTVGYAYNEEIFQYHVATLTDDDTTGNLLFLCPPGKSGRIVGAYLINGENGADGTDPMSVEADVTINGTSIFTTQPALTKAAGSGKKTTFNAGTGITVGVIDPDEATFAAADIVLAELDITATTPDTAYANTVVLVVVRWDTV